MTHCLSMALLRQLSHLKEQNKKHLTISHVLLTCWIYLAKQPEYNEILGEARGHFQTSKLLKTASVTKLAAS